MDAGGCIVAPGLVDLHTHLRQPGHEEAETVETGSRAGRSAATPRSWPCPTPRPPSTRRRWSTRCSTSGARRCATSTSPAPSRSGGRARSWPRSGRWPRSACGSSPTTAGACRTPRLMRRAMEYASDLDVILAQHCEDEAIAQGGAMHEGEWSSRLGLPGQPAEAEELMVQPRPGPRPADRRPGPLPAPVHRRLPRHGAGRAGRRPARSPPRPRPTTSRSPTRPARATTRSSRSTLRCARRRTGRGQGRAGRRRARRHRHRPRSPRPAPEGAALRPGAAGDARPARRRWRWP